MKHFLIPICLFISLVSYAQSQQDLLQYKVIYELNFQPDSTDIHSQKKEIMWLFLGEKTSEFLSKGRAFKDSISKNRNLAMLGSTSMKDKMAATKTDFDYKIYKHRNTQELFYSLKILEDKIFYTEALPALNWEIKPETKEISDYSAQKAITEFAGRSYIAWFTSEIPIPDGPYKFSGLPGLILEISDSSEEYVFNFKAFEEINTKIPLTLPPDDYQKSSKEDLLALKNRYEEDPMKYINNYVGTEGKKITVKLNGQSKNDYLRKRKAKLAKKNNPIELEKP